MAPSPLVRCMRSCRRPPSHLTSTPPLLFPLPCPALLQCGRFHPLDSFDGDMRSCRRQLARHAERRRAARAAAAAAKRGAAQSSPGSSQAAGSGSEGAALLPPVCAAPASPTPADASAAVVNVSLSQQAAAAAVDHLPQPKDDPQSRELPQAQASGSESGSSSLGCSQGVPRSSSPSGGLDALLAAAEEEEAAERQAAAERRAAAEQRGTSKRRAVELGGQQELPAPKRPTSAPPPEEWFAPPLAATWPAPSKPASPMPDAAVLSSLSEQTSLAAAPAPLLPPLLPLASLPPLPALPTPALVGPMAAAMASLGASLQLLQQQHAFMPHIAGLPVPPGTGLEAYVAGLASMAAERIVAELLTASQR